MRTLLLLIVASLALPAAAAERPKVLVLKLNGSLEEDQRVAIGNLVAAELSSYGVEVVSSSDVAAMAELEGEKQALGCESETSCLAEIAGALGASLVIYGDVTRLGSRLVFNLNFFDSSVGRVVGRKTQKAASLDEVIDQVGLTLYDTVAAPLQARDVSVPPRPSGAVAPGPAGEGPPILSIALFSAGGLALVGAAATTFIALGHEEGAAGEPVQLARQSRYAEADTLWIATAALASVGAAALIGGVVFLGGE